MRSLILVAIVFSLACSTTRAVDEGPEQQVMALVKQLQGEKASTTFQDLFANTLAGERKPTEVRLMDAQARTAWDFYGPPLSHEIVERQAIGKKLYRIKWITWHKDGSPLFWNGLFVKRGGKWEAFNLFFFDDPSKAGF